MTINSPFRGGWLASRLAMVLGASSLGACSPRAAEPAAGPAPASEAGPAATTGRATGTPTASATPRPAEPEAEPEAAETGSSKQATTGGDSLIGPPPAATADSQYLRYDPASKTVTFRLVAGPFSWNGYTSGSATLTVPPASITVINFEQADGTPHSAEVASGTGPIPNSGGDPAIPRAYTNKVVEGLVQGATDVIRFTAPDSGTYRLICGVPGHALSGMWIWFKVDPAATAPTFGPTPK